MTTAEVILWGTRIGFVSFDDSRNLGMFEYDPMFLQSGIEVSPLMMPLSKRVYSFPELNAGSFHGLPGLLSDSLPDKFGNAVINAWLGEHGRSPESFNPVERLCYTGSRGMGALEYIPSRGPSANEGESIAVDRLVELASKVLKIRNGLNVRIGDDAIREIVKVGSSAGGARAKAVIAWNEQSDDIRSGQVPAGKGYGYWLMKFDGVAGNGDKEGPDPAQYTRIEYAYYLMAVDAGIQMEECRLYEENGRAHFMTRRFDRDKETHAKKHMQSLGAIGHFDFNQSGSCSYEEAVRVMRQLGIKYDEIRQFYRRMVFNVLAMNRDDHVKNISFMMDRTGRWTLSPAYDVTYAFNPGGEWTSSHQMTINGKQKGIKKADLLQSAKHMGLGSAEAEKIIDEVGGSISLWNSFAEMAGLREENARAIEKMINQRVS